MADDNVIPLWERREDKPEPPPDEIGTAETRNRRNAERLKRERAQHNKKVLRSYRLKP